MIKNLYTSNNLDIHFRRSGDISILNIGAGKIDPINIDRFRNYFLVNLDKNYTCHSPVVADSFYEYEYKDPKSKYMIAGVDSYYEEWENKKRGFRRTIRNNTEVFNFISTFAYKFDFITMYRFLEHIPFDKVLQFIYLLSTALKKDGLLDIIVPDYQMLANMILEESPNMDADFDKNNIILTTELLNEPSDPHASIWTESRIWYYFGYENRFKIENIIRNFKFDGRDIYLRASVRRI